MQIATRKRLQISVGAGIPRSHPEVHYGVNAFYDNWILRFLSSLHIIIAVVVVIICKKISASHRLHLVCFVHIPDKCLCVFLCFKLGYQLCGFCIKMLL